MFFFWGPFVFLLPALIIFLILRAVLGTQHHRRRGSLDYGSDPFDLLSERDPDERGGYSMRVQIYKLAYKLGGRITVSDIVVQTGLEVEEAEELIESMVDNQRVRMEVQDDGLVIYEFPELINRFKER